MVEPGTRYVVTKVTRCPRCKGMGIVTHPVWQRYFAEHSANKSKTLDDWQAHLKDTFREMGYNEVPDEEIECPDCEGSGEIRKEVDLSVLLRDSFGLETQL